MKKLVFTFGRMNPPTIGHEKLANKIKEVARKENANPRIYLSHTQNPKKDPLSYNDKFRFAKKAFGIVQRSQSKQIFQILPEIEKEGFTDIIMVVGSDRIGEFDRVLQKYNGKDYNFNSIKTVSSGDRDPDAQGVEGMSGSKLRAVAMSGDEKTFKSGLASKLSDADKTKIYNLVRKNLKEAIMNEWTEEDDLIVEEALEEAEFDEKDYDALVELGKLYEMNEVLNITQRLAKSRVMKRIGKKLARARKIASKKMKSAGKLAQMAKKAAIAAMRKKLGGQKGASYASLSPSDKMNIDKKVEKKKSVIAKMAQRMLPKVRKDAMARVAMARKGPQNNEYIPEGKIEEKYDLYHSTFSGAMQHAYDYAKKKFGIQIPDSEIDSKVATGPKKPGTGKTNTYRLKGRGGNLQIQVYNKGGSKPFELNMYKEEKDKEGKKDVAQDPDIKDREGTQPKSYFKGVKKSTKDDRDRAFKKGADKHHDDPSAYPKSHPGDSGAKTKLSKHTKKYRDMFGEALKHTHMVLDPDGRVMSMHSSERHANDSAKPTGNLLKKQGKVVKLRKPISTARGDRLIGQLPAHNLGEGKRVSPKILNLMKVITAYKQEKPGSKERENMLKFINKELKAMGKQPIKDNGVRTIRMGEGDNIKAVNKAIEREKQADAKKFDRLRDRARTADTKVANRKEDIGIDEISTKKINRYYDKAKQSHDRAGNSAFARHLRKEPGIEKDLDTMRKRKAGIKLAKNIAIKKLRGEKPGKLIQKREEFEIEEKKLGLWDRIRAKRASGRKMNPKGHKDAPTDDEIRKAKGESSQLGEAIPKSTMYALVQKGKVVAKGSKSDMMSKKKKEGGTVYNAPSKKVGDAMKEAMIPVGKMTGKGFEPAKKGKDVKLPPHLKDLKTIRKAFAKTKKVKEDIDYSSYMTEDATAALKKKAEKSGMPLGILRQVYNRGMAAWRTGHRPGASQQQWAFARVNSFITKSSGTWGKADKDLAAKVRGSKSKKESINEYSAGEEGTTKLLKQYQKDTPGQGKEIKSAYNPDDDFSGKLKKKFKELRKTNGFDSIKEEIEEKLSKRQQDKLDDLESYLGHLQRVTLTPSRRAEIDATKKKIKKLKSEESEEGDIEEMTGINVPELIKTTIHRLTHPKGYADIMKDYIKRVKQPHKGSNGSILSDIAKERGFDRVKPIQDYINRLIIKGKLPKSLMASHCREEVEIDEDGCPIDLFDHVLEEAEYQGKKVTLNDPVRSSDGKKKFHVYVKNEKGNVIKLGFGDPNMEIKRDDPARRKSFRARHNCDNPGPKYKARYWSCYQWRGSAKVDN